MKIILTTACDDNFVPLLLGMMESLGNRLEKHDFGICDIGLTKESKDKIHALKPDVIFKDPTPFIDLPSYKKSQFSVATQCKPFANMIFKNYDGYVHIDSDIWFSDPSGLDDLIAEGQKHGIACVYEAKEVLKVRKRFLGISLYKYEEPTAYATIRRAHGEKEAWRLVQNDSRRMNGGLAYIKGDHKFWKLYQEAGRKSVEYAIKNREKIKFCDQTAFLYALLDSNISHAILPYTHNCIELDKILLDKKAGKLLYSDTGEEVKAIHITGNDKTAERTLKTTNGDSIKTAFTYQAIKELKL